MMKNFLKTVSLLLVLILSLSVLFSCGETEKDETPAEVIDYSASVKLEMTSSTAKCEVTVKTYIDGDTTHFNVPYSVAESGVLKARYLAINTPESTGKIEEWGKAASKFTKEKLQNAVSIYVESDTADWDLDSTGGRYLVWVWYKTANDTDYRNLNIEILQNGLALASSSANNRYGETCTAAIAQAKAQKLNIYSGEKDPDFYYGDAVELTIKELRCNIDEYSNMKVAFEGVITMNNDNSVYIEELDPESGVYFGMAVYYGFSLSGEGLDILAVGNRARIVGTVQYYEAGDSWQVSGLTYRQMKPDDPGNIKKISSGNEAAFTEVSADTFKNGKVTVTLADGSEKQLGWAEASLNSSISMKNLKVKSVYTTSNESSSQKGALTLTCECDGIEISVRTIVLYDKDGNLVTEDAFRGKTIDVKGLLDKYNGSYQIKVLNLDSITIK